MREYAIAGSYLEFIRWVRENRRERSGVIFLNTPERCEGREPGVLHRIGNWQESAALEAALKLELT